MSDRILFSIGEALIDMIPSRAGCSFDEVPAFSPRVGGAPANVCATVARLGGRSALLSQLGDDPFGHKIARVLAGCLWCVTIIGIPVGLQCFKFASLAFFPFGKEVIYGGGGVSFLVNLIWIVFFGLEMAIGYVILGCLWCITLLGIPIGKQCFKMAKLSLMPFGASVI